MKNNKASYLLLTIMLVLPVLVSSACIFYFSKYETTIAGFGFLEWMLFYCITAFTMAFALTPTTFIALVTGYFAGWAGLYGLIPSYMVASLMGFSLASFVDKGSFFEHIRKKEKVRLLMENIKSDELWVIFFCRLSPALPFAMMNVFLSFMKVKMKDFLGGSLLGMLPRTLLSLWIGTQASDMIRMLKGKEEREFSKLLILTLLVFSVAGLYWMFMRAMRKK